MVQLDDSVSTLRSFREQAGQKRTRILFEYSTSRTRRSADSFEFRATKNAKPPTQMEQQNLPANREWEMRLGRLLLHDFNFVGRDPDVNLLELFLQTLLVVGEEGFGIWIVRVHADANQIVPIPRAAVFPGPADPNGVECDPAEPIAQFLGGPIEFFGLDLGPVVIIQR